MGARGRAFKHEVPLAPFTIFHFHDALRSKGITP
jgi:hypothetical protein